MCVIFKVDFEKAYDSVNWSFLDYMLQGFGFDNKWRGWMKACIFAGSLLVLVNGCPTEQINISKGLKQVDPLAPFLFLLVAEGLGGLMRKADELGFFKRIKIGEPNIVLSHLQYADDTLFIGEACVKNLWCMKAILRWFELISGLKVNFHKSKLFGINLEDGFLDLAASFLKCRIGNFPFIYLDLRWELIQEELQLGSRLLMW
ncbi:ribonuclease H [Trifolium pratense]|uniref:Ribonuclease H n=1 Tax=Trifolium pratense TaxID=57577 RepID=A0A2K3MSN4_TRIPR|nr:ribonuclease H [Trifolium pratense]